MLSRRAFLKTGVGVATAASGLLEACSPDGGGVRGRRLHVMMNGGFYEEVARRYVVEPFQDELGVQVRIVPATTAQILTRLMAERSAPAVDVVILDQMLAAKGIAEGLFDKIDPENIPHLEDLEDQAIDPRGYGPIVHSHSLSLGMNTDLLDVDPPESWADLWHPRFKGMVCPGAIELTPGLLLFMQASFHNGGTYTNMDPGFEALRSLAPNIRKYYHGLGEVRPLLNNENVIVAVSSNVTQGEIDKGNPIRVVFPKEGCLASPAVAQVVKGTRVKDLAERFIDHYLRPEAQFQWAKSFYLTVFNKRVSIPDDLRSRIADKIVFFDPVETARHRDEWVERWVREIRV